MSDVSDARSRMVERLRSSGADPQTAAHMAERSIRRVSEKINSGENPTPTDSNSARERIKEKRQRD
jgi:hypothetical protein